MGMRDVQNKVTEAERLLTLAGGHVTDATRPRDRATASEPLPKGWEPTAKMGADGLPAELISPAFPDDLPEKDALEETLRLLAVMVPPGYRARIAEVKLGSDWYRVHRGDDAQRDPSKPTRRFRWIIEPETLDGFRLNGEDLREFLDAVRDLTPPKAPRRKKKNTRPLVVTLADPQIGQSDGDGLAGQALRIASFPKIVAAEIDRLSDAGRIIDQVVIAVPGDLVENVLGFYPGQASQVEANLSTQLTTAVQLIGGAIAGVAELGLPVEVISVPGNHGENRNAGGKIVTDPYDNFDMHVMRTVAWGLGHNPVLAKQVTFAFPHETSFHLVREYNGTLLGLAHGHTAKAGGGDPVSKIKAWYKAQAAARTPIGGCDVLLTGHYHHAVFMDLFGGTQWVQAPAMCDSSEHFTQVYGLTGGPGVVSFTLADGRAEDFMVHRMPTYGRPGSLRAVS